MSCIFAVSVAMSVAMSVQAAVISQAVGQVGSQVITSREVQISYALDQAALVKIVDKNLNRNQWNSKLGDENFKAHLNQMMIELLVRAEAESFSVAHVSIDEIHRESEALRAKMVDWAEWQKWEVSDPEVEQIVARRKMVKQFLKFKTESSGVVISDEEAKAYFEKNKVKFGSANFVQFKETIKDVLAQKQLEEKLKDWFEILRRKYRVRFLNGAGAKES